MDNFITPEMVTQFGILGWMVYYQQTQFKKSIDANTKFLIAIATKLGLNIGEGEQK